MQTKAWRSNDNFASNILNEGIRRDHPLQQKEKSKIISQKQNDYIKFGHSSFETDSSQTAVPFWDALPVVLVPAVPLVGAGIFYKSNGNSGGYIAPIIFPYKDLSGLIPIQYSELIHIVNSREQEWIRFMNDLKLMSQRIYLR